MRRNAERCGSLHRPIREDHRIPDQAALAQVQRSLRNLHRIGQEAGLPVGIAEGDGALEFVATNPPERGTSGFSQCRSTRNRQWAGERNTGRSHPGPRCRQIH